MTARSHPADAGHSSDWAFRRLFQLESECRSPTPAVQVEAIGKFPKLLDQFPFPTLVGSAFLKLGDLFRSSQNALRHHIAQVFEASQHHLAQVTHTEELLKRILVVLYSNDPIARVLALRLVGNASSVFAGFPEAQHGILLRYQSSHPLEIAAAVQTTELMLKYSPGFLSVVWETVLAKADDAQVPDSVRVQLIRSLRHAAPNLQLSTQLYPRCRRWAEHPDSTPVVQTAALETWRSIVQPHNELALDDAACVSELVAHRLDSVRRAALALLARWQPADQATDANAAHLNEIEGRLRSYLGARLDGDDAELDLRGFRLATVVLVRIEAARAGPVSSWELAERLAGRALRSFAGSLHAGAQAYRYLVSSVMLVINVATVLGPDSRRASAALAVRDAWLAISGVDQGARDVEAYVRRFLRVSWAWCRCMGVEEPVAAAIPALLGARGCAVACKAVAIASLPRHFGRASPECTRHINGFVSGLESGCVDEAALPAVWNSILATLAHSQQHTDDADAEAVDLPAKAIMAWSAHICSLADQPEAHLGAIASTGPPPWAVQRLLALLAMGGRWRTTEQLCQALLTYDIGSKLQSQIYALSLLSSAEASGADAAGFASTMDTALSTLRALDDQGAKCTYRLFVVQIRCELVDLHSGWAALCSAGPSGPAAVFTAKSLVRRTCSLGLQVDLVHDSFPTADRATREWLSRVRAALRRAADPLDECWDIPATAGAAAAAVGSVSAAFRPGPALLIEPPVPTICIETRPSLDRGDPALAVLSGSQFHFVAEGFLHLPRRPLPTAPVRVRIAVWLSQYPRSGSGQDLPACSEYYAIAQGARRAAINDVPAEPTDGGGDGGGGDGGDRDSSSAAESATAFEAPIEAAYFRCPCAVSTPSLRAVLGPVEASAISHIHVFCGLVDASGRAWWTGPHVSYPLLVSTTARA
ncbi:hypothetical protein H4R18_002724 [Coemansia javaensis]|uniref:Integrator complex subunit 7 N-terminal domain-containing protein n=1 Tax=Coemansia javaensis TaxID=2761396 RepID=A0A9W8LIB0_9FUNG|nr:hypothetical protein H4R18_002724 [Coemansia javaensis]